MAVTCGARPVRHPVRWLMTIVGLSVLLKVGGLLALGRWAQPTLWEYEEVAVSLAAGHGFRSEFLSQPYRSEIQPLYPLLCAGLYRLFGHRPEAVQVMQILLASLLCAVAYGIGRRVFSERAGLWGAGFVAIHPGLSYYATANLHVLVLDALLFASVVWAVLYLEESWRLRRVVLAGGLLGLALLSRASVLVFVPVGLAWLWYRVRVRVRPGMFLAHGALLLAIASGLVSPWLIRNYRVHGRPVYFLSTVGSGLWTGNNPHASGSTLTPAGTPVRFTASPEFLEELYRLPEREQDDYFKRAAYDYIRAHPWTALRLYAKKLGAFWWRSPQTGLEYPKSWFNLYYLWYSMTLIFGGVGVWTAWRRGEGARVAVLVLFGWSIAACQSLFYVEGRHRWEIETLLLVAAAGGWVWVCERLCYSRRGVMSSTFDLPPRALVPSLADEEWDQLTGLIYHPLTGQVYQRRFRYMLKPLEGMAGARILEVGCGAGLLLSNLKPFAERVVGLDLHDGLPQVRRMLSQIGQADPWLVRGSVLTLPFQSACFDAVLCMSVLEHLRDLDRAILELARVLRPGGRLVLGFPAKTRLTRWLFKLIGRDDDVIHPSSHHAILAAARRHLRQQHLRVFPRLLPEALSLYLVGSFRHA